MLKFNYYGLVAMAATATMAAACVSFAAVFVVMMVALHVGVVVEATIYKCLYCIVAAALATSIKFYAQLRQCHLCSSANTATYKGVYLHVV